MPAMTLIRSTLLAAALTLGISAPIALAAGSISVGITFGAPGGAKPMRTAHDEAS